MPPLLFLAVCWALGLGRAAPIASRCPVLAATRSAPGNLRCFGGLWPASLPAARGGLPPGAMPPVAPGARGSVCRAAALRSAIALSLRRSARPLCPLSLRAGARALRRVLARCALGSALRSGGAPGSPCPPCLLAASAAAARSASFPLGLRPFGPPSPLSRASGGLRPASALRRPAGAGPAGLRPGFCASGAPRRRCRLPCLPIIAPRARASRALRARCALALISGQGPRDVGTICGHNTQIILSVMVTIDSVAAI